MIRIGTVVMVLVALAAATAERARGQTSAPVRLAATAMFGCADCAGPLLLSSVRSVAWLDGQRIVVLDGEAPFVRLFTPDGRLLVAFGAEGSGPGELRLPMAAAAVAPHELEVIDMRLLRVTRYTDDGSVITTRALPRSAFPLAAGRDARTSAWVLLTTDFRRATPDVRRLADGADEAVPILEGAADFPRDRDGEPTWNAAFAVARDGSFALGEGAFAYRIRRHASDGEPVHEIVRDMPRPRRTAAEMRAQEDRRARHADRLRAMRAAEGGGPGPLPPVPEERNHFDMGALAFDDAGRLWVRTTRGGERRTVFDLFGDDGTWLGEVAVDAVVREWALGAGALAGVVESADGVPRVGVWRVEVVR